MKYLNLIESNLKIYDLFTRFLSGEELKVLGRNSTLHYLSSFSEIIKLNNHAVCVFEFGVRTRLIVGRKDSIQYFFDGISNDLRGLIRSSLLNGNMTDFIKIASKNELISSFFSLVSDDVQSWLINRVNAINVIYLNQYQFIEKRRGINYITLYLYVKSDKLGGSIRYKDTNDCINFDILSDEHLITSYVDKFLKEHYNEIY